MIMLNELARDRGGVAVTDLDTPSAPASDQVAGRTTSVLLRLQAWPAISVVVATTPSPVMRRRDAARIAALLHELKGSLARLPAVDADAVLERLRRLAEHASRLPAQRGVAMFAGGPLDEVVVLPVPVRTRAVVDRTFHVRDILHAEQHEQRSRVLVVDNHSARLYDDERGSLVERRGRFPIAGPEIVGTEAFRMQLVAALHDDVRDTWPLIVAAANREFIPATELAHLTTFAGAVVLPRHPSDLDELKRLSRQRADEWRRTHITEAVVAATSDPAWQRGVPDVWEAVNSRLPGDVVVEAGFHYPGGGRVLIGRDTQNESLAGRADAVEDVVAMVARAGGEVVFVADGALAAVGRIAYQPAGPQTDPVATLLARRAASAYPSLALGPTPVTRKPSAPRMPLRRRDRRVTHASPNVRTKR
jgi:hypothetical protein